MKFSQTIKNTDPTLIVSKRLDAWLAENTNPVYSLPALQFARKELGKQDRVRKGTFSASSLGSCQRAQQFGYLGMPQLPFDQKSALKVHNGNFMHLRWQMYGLTEGWLKEAEVALGANEYKMSGTMDGILYDDSILELKSTNANGFSRVQAFGPMISHMFQMATYMLCTGRTSGVFIYECKDNQEYKEIVLTSDEVPLLGARNKARDMWRSVETQTLFEPLAKCIDKTGWEYNSCPYRDRCLQIHEWEEVGERSDAHH